jgi:hypothetical protein
MLTARALSWPAEAASDRLDPDAGRRFQGVLAQLLLRESGLSVREDPLTLTTTEVNAFLARHVEVRDAPVWPVSVRLERGEVELGGATTLGRLVATGLGAGRDSVFPRLLDYPVWVAVGGQVTVGDGRGEFVARTAAIGRQRVPVRVLWRLLGGQPRALHWRMPRIVERVDTEPGRLRIHTRRIRSGGALRG